MSSRPFFLLPLCFVSALALNAYAALDPTGVYQDYLEKLDAATPPVAAMATAAADGVYPWSEPKVPEPPPVPDPAPLPDPEPEPEPEEPASPFTTVDASYFDDALFIGDSHTDGFKDYAGLNNADYLCHNGLTVWSAVEKAEFPGKQTLAQALSGKHYGKIYLMLGINELGTGTAESKASVYGCCGLENSSSLGAYSKIWPLYITAISSHKKRATAKSCETNNIDKCRFSLISFNKFKICA